MLIHVIAWSLRNAVVVVVLAAVLIAASVFAVQRMAVDVFPELNAPTVTILTEAGGLSAEEVEQYVSFPVESAVNGLPDLRRVRSASSLGLSIVWTEFTWGTDIYRARQMVSERIDGIRDELPPNTHMQMGPISSITGEIMLISVTSAGKAQDPLAMRAFAEYDLRQRLLAVPGVSQVVAVGGWLPEYQVEVRQEQLLAYDLTTEDIATAVGGSHNLTSAGFLIDVEGLELPLRQSGRVSGVDDIAATVVTYADNAPVTLGDVATISIGGAYRRGAATDSARPAVVIGVTKAPGTNTLALSQRIDAQLDRLTNANALPPGIVLDRHAFRQDRFIQRSVDTVTQVLIEAGVIVAIVLMLFLMNWRTTLITLTALPISLGITLVVMWATGMTINVMTLGGLAVAIGILVDDAIIDVENVHRRLAEWGRNPDQRSRRRVIFDASNEIRSSVVFATVIICLVFVPLLFLEGLEGRFFKPLAITYMVSVLCSLVIALTVTPALCWLLLKPDTKATERPEDGFVVRALKAGYRPLLAACLRLRAITLGIAAAAVALALWLATTFGTSFLPEFNEGTYTVFLMMPPGTSLNESERVSIGVQQQLMTVPGIEHVVSRSGRAERDEHAEPPSNTEMDVRLAPDADHQAVLTAIDSVLADVPGVTTSVGQPISHRLSHVLSGTRAQIAIDIYGDDLAVLREVAAEVAATLDSIAAVRDVNANREILVDSLIIDFDRVALARYGLTPADVGKQVRRAAFGEQVVTVNQGVRRLDIAVRLDQDQRDSVSDLRNLILTGSNGALVRLHEVATVDRERSPNLISRHNAQRKAVVSCNVAAGFNLGDTVSLLRESIQPIITGTGTTVHFGGQFEAQQSATARLTWIGLAIAVVMMGLLAMATGGLPAALVVMLNIPLALIGGVLAVAVTSGGGLGNLGVLAGGSYVAPVLSIASLVGFITLFGIAVRNGILLVNHIRWLLLHETSDLVTAVRLGSEQRLVPVLMTALSAALGLIPLALQAGQPGAELLAPLAIVILSGLVTATILNMLVVPAAYMLMVRTLPSRDQVAADDLPV